MSISPLIKNPTNKTIYAINKCFLWTFLIVMFLTCNLGTACNGKPASGKIKISPLDTLHSVILYGVKENLSFSEGWVLTGEQIKRSKEDSSFIESTTDTSYFLRVTSAVMDTINKKPFLNSRGNDSIRVDTVRLGKEYVRGIMYTVDGRPLDIEKLLKSLDTTSKK